MKIDMELKPGDITLLKVLACVVIAFFMIRFLIFPGIERHQDLVMQQEELSRQKEQMQTLMEQAPSLEQTIKDQRAALKDKTADYSGLLENQAVDELVTGLILDHDLFPVYLNIAEPQAGVPQAYVLSSKGQEEQAAAAEAAGSDTETADTVNEAADVETNSVQYVNTTLVTLTIQGSEEHLQSFLNDIAVSHPDIQVQSFSMDKGTYLSTDLQAVESMNCNCVLAVYTCGDLTDPAFGEETDQ